MHPSLRPLLGFSVLAATGCSAPITEERSAEVRQPIVGGIADVFRSYVVGVGMPYDPSRPGDLTVGPICSGTLISRRTVLTAGHCVTPIAGPQEGITAVFFGPDITYPLPPSATVVSTVQAVLHPGFDSATFSNDLALVELAADAPSQAVPLLRETMTNTPEFVGPYFTFSGYGYDEQRNHGVRQVAAFPINAVGPACVGTWLGPIDSTEIYFRVKNKNTCTGDSGGPAFIPRQNVERLAGATSGGDPNCTVDGADARTDLPQIKAFIQPTIDLFENMDPCRADGTCNEACNAGNSLGDPDCAPNHCSADGICVLSCVDPPDPDCPTIDHCLLDGVCSPTCSPGDPDCLPPPDAGAAGTGGNCSADGAANGGSEDAGPPASGVDAGADGSPDASCSAEGHCAPRQVAMAVGGCACRIDRHGSDGLAGEASLIAIVLGVRRRRPRRYRNR